MGNVQASVERGNVQASVERASLNDLTRVRIRETRANECFVYFYLRRAQPRLVLKIAKRNVGALLDWLEDIPPTQASLFNRGVVQFVWRQLT